MQERDEQVNEADPSAMGTGYAERDELVSLVDAGRKGDRAALSDIYERFCDRIYRYALFKLEDSQQAEDLCAQVFLKMMESIGRFEWPPLRGDDKRVNPASFSSWLYRIAHNLITDQQRREARRPTVPLDSVAHYLPDNIDPALTAETVIFRERLAVALKSLTELQAQVIALKFGSGLSNAEVAQMLGRSEGAIKALQYKALQKLHHLLGARIESLTAKDCMSKVSIEDALDDCWQRLPSEGLDASLRRYPEYADELRGLLQLSMMISRISATAMLSDESRERMRARLFKSVPATTDHPSLPIGLVATLVPLRTLPFPIMLPHPTALGSLFSRALIRAVLIILVLAAMFVGASAASAHTVPGDALYPLKRLDEGIRYSISFNDEDKASARLDFASTRLDEMEALYQRGGMIDTALLTDLNGNVSYCIVQLKSDSFGTKQQLASAFGTVLQREQRVLGTVGSAVVPGAKLLYKTTQASITDDYQAAIQYAPTLAPLTSPPSPTTTSPGVIPTLPTTANHPTLLPTPPTPAGVVDATVTPVSAAATLVAPPSVTPVGVSEPTDPPTGATPQVKPSYTPLPRRSPTPHPQPPTTPTLIEQTPAPRTTPPPPPPTSVPQPILSPTATPTDTAGDNNGQGNGNGHGRGHGSGNGHGGNGNG